MNTESSDWRAGADDELGLTQPQTPPEQGQAGADDELGLTQPQASPEHWPAEADDESGQTRPQASPEHWQAEADDESGQTRPQSPLEQGQAGADDESGQTRPQASPEHWQAEADDELGQTRPQAPLEQESVPDSEAGSAPASTLPPLPADERENPYGGISPENFIDLPHDNYSFQKAIEELKLPEMICGKPFECVVKLFTCNNSFEKRIRLIRCSIVNQEEFPDCHVELDAARAYLHLRGTARQEGKLKIRIEYKAVPAEASEWASAARDKTFSCDKTLVISPDPLIEINRQFQKSMEAGNFDQRPDTGEVGRKYESTLDLTEELAKFGKKIKLLSCEVVPPCGIEAKINGDRIDVTGTPLVPGKLSLELHYSLELSGGTKEDQATIPYADIEPELAWKEWDEFEKNCKRTLPRRAMAGRDIEFAIDLPPVDSSCLKLEEEVDVPDSLTARYDRDTHQVKVSGNPKTVGEVTLTIFGCLTTVAGDVPKKVCFPVLVVTPDPKTLWKDLPTDPNAPYQADDEYHTLIKADGMAIVAASKRGRSHAHNGKFRDDYFLVDYLEDGKWFIVAVSDGAGSAKFSRAGARIACETFCGSTRERLSRDNEKIDNMEPAERETFLKNQVVLTAAYQGLTAIDAEARKAAEKDAGVTRKDYSATLLGYVMKRFEDGWLIASIGIGDGIIGVLDKDDHLELLSEPDGGEFVGQTRFITMNEVWRNSPAARTRSLVMKDFQVIMSMTDGVSDPKFETDNNLKSEPLWMDLWNDLRNQLPMEDCSEITAQKLSEWLDFWAKGNHDDRTLVLVYPLS